MKKLFLSLSLVAALGASVLAGLPEKTNGNSTLAAEIQRATPPW